MPVDDGGLDPGNAGRGGDRVGQHAQQNTVGNVDAEPLGVDLGGAERDGRAADQARGGVDDPHRLQRGGLCRGEGRQAEPVQVVQRGQHQRRGPPVVRGRARPDQRDREAWPAPARARRWSRRGRRRRRSCQSAVMATWDIPNDEPGHPEAWSDPPPKRGGSPAAKVAQSRRSAVNDLCKDALTLVRVQALPVSSGGNGEPAVKRVAQDWAMACEMPRRAACAPCRVGGSGRTTPR